MKIIYKLYPFLFGFIFCITSAGVTQAQGPGNFYVVNNTGCTYDVVLYHTGSGCSGSGCNGTRVTAQNQAQPNSTTKVDDGSGYAGSDAWIQVDIQDPQGNIHRDGYCASTTPGPECLGADITLTWIDCNNSQID